MDRWRLRALAVPWNVPRVQPVGVPSVCGIVV